MCLCLFFRKFPVACSHQCSSDKLPLHPAEVILLFFSCYVWPLFAISWSIARQAPLSMDFPRQECWSRWPSPSARDLPNLGIKLVSPASAGGFCTNESCSHEVYQYSWQVLWNSSLHNWSWLDWLGCRAGQSKCLTQCEIMLKTLFHYISGS